MGRTPSNPAGSIFGCFRMPRLKPWPTQGAGRSGSAGQAGECWPGLDADGVGGLLRSDEAVDAVAEFVQAEEVGRAGLGAGAGDDGDDFAFFDVMVLFEEGL